MRIPRSRGAISGLLLMVLGAWGALIPFIGPYFDVSIGTDQTWDWTTGRLWLSILPGVVAFVGGFLTLTSAHRARAGFGAWMAIAAGAWFVVGPTVSMLWNDGRAATGSALGSSGRRVLELLVMYDGLGVVIAILGAFALGRLAVRSVRDVELAREAESERSTARRDDDRFARQPDAGRRDRPGASAPVAAAPAQPRERGAAADGDAPTAVSAASRRPSPDADPSTTAAREPAPRDTTSPSPTASGAPATDPSDARPAGQRSGGLLRRLRGS
jgi:hypothetical protein